MNLALKKLVGHNHFNYEYVKYLRGKIPEFLHFIILLQQQNF